MRVHVEHWKILPAKRLTAGCFSRAFAQGRIENVGTAPGSIPDLRIYLGVPRKRILLPFVPSHGTINSSQRPDQNLVQRSPYSPRNRRPWFRLRNTAGDSVRTVADLDGADRRRTPQLLIDGFDKSAGLFLAGRTANQRPWLRLHP